MNDPKAYGSFVKKGDHTFRTSAYIQWGDLEKSIGSSLLLNPGSAKLDKDLTVSLNTRGSANGLIQTADPTMKQLIKVVEGIYKTGSPINGRFHIYNLFTLQNTKSVHAIDQFETLVDSGFYDIKESLVELNVLQSHPWILLGWGVERKPSWKNLESIKEMWGNLLSQLKVPTFGKKHLKTDDYYHPCPLIPTHQPPILAELIMLYKQKFNKHRFPIHATKPNLLVDPSPINPWDEFAIGWFKSSSNPELIVMGYSHLRIKDGYKLRAYQYSDGANGNGVVWAIPADKELTEPEKCDQLDEHFLAAPKPSFAANDFMQAIEGDRTPMSYLQASIVIHELYEFGAVWHGTSWGRDIILPLNDDQNSNANYYEWDMIEDEPEVIDPHFYYSSEGFPIVVFHTINDIGTVTMNRYVHTFSKDDYTMQIEQTCIATAGNGIIF